MKMKNYVLLGVLLLAMQRGYTQGAVDPSDDNDIYEFVETTPDQPLFVDSLEVSGDYVIALGDGQTATAIAVEDFNTAAQKRIKRWAKGRGKRRALEWIEHSPSGAYTIRFKSGGGFVRYSDANPHSDLNSWKLTFNFTCDESNVFVMPDEIFGHSGYSHEVSGSLPASSGKEEKAIRAIMGAIALKPNNSR